MSRSLSVATVLFLISFIGLNSCKKDDPIHNYFTYELIKYEIDEGIIEFYGKLDPDSEGYNFDITLFSTGITFDPLAGELNGTGNLVVLEIFSDSPDKLTPGTYSYDLTATQDSFTFDRGTFGLFVNMDDHTGTAVLVNSGTVDISRDGANYSLVFDCMTSADNSITGSYTGALEFHDVSGK